MHITTIDEAERRGGYAHRPGGIAFHSLLKGRQGSPDNFDLMLVDAADYRTPRHRHNFDQVRIMLDGRFEWEPGHVQEPGTIGYFPEGVFYTQNGVGPSRMLLLQSGGASGHGYMSAAQLREGISRLQSRGRFEDGIYRWIDADGKRHNADGYEAAWEEMHGRPISYPKPRYERPIVFHEERFAWQSVADGIERRSYGAFTERALGVARWRLDAHATWRVEAADQSTLLFVIDGFGEAAGRSIGPQAAIHVETGERLSLQARTPMSLYVITLMRR